MTLPIFYMEIHSVRNGCLWTLLSPINQPRDHAWLSCFAIIAYGFLALECCIIHCCQVSGCWETALHQFFTCGLFIPSMQQPAQFESNKIDIVGCFWLIDNISSGIKAVLNAQGSEETIKYIFTVTHKIGTMSTFYFQTNISSNNYSNPINITSFES